MSAPTYGIYADSKRTNYPTSTVYTVEEKEESNRQYPLGYITKNQQTLVHAFLKGLCGHDSFYIDRRVRGIHTIGTWRCTNPATTVVCTAVQPHVTNAIVHIVRGVPTSRVICAREDYMATVGGTEPSVNTITGCPQPQGALAVPFTDYMLIRKVVTDANVQWSNTVLSKTQPIFTVITDTACYECVLTHTSCNIMSKNTPEDAIIMPPSSRSESYSFRRLSITHGKGSGPSVTVHKSGTMQYQGGGKHIESLTSNFRNCIDHIMSSEQSENFIRSLDIIRDLGSIMSEVQ